MITPGNMPKMVYANYIVHDNGQIKAKNIYIIPIYMYAMLGLDIYGPYIYIYIPI